MPGYTYKAKDSGGKTINGTLEAATQQEVIGKLREMGYWPLDIQPVAQRKLPRRSFTQTLIQPFYTGVSLRTRALMFRQMAQALDAGMSIIQVLERLSSRARGPLRRILCRALDNVMQGKPMSEVLEQEPYVFSQLEIAMIRAGETGGFFQKSIEQIADYLERDLDIRRKIRMRTFYPKLLLVMIFLIPGIEVAVLSSPLVWLKMKMIQAWAILKIVLPVYIVVKLALTVPSFKFVWDVIKSSLPSIGTQVRKLGAARFCRAMSAAYSGGLSLPSSVRLAADVYDNEYLSRPIRRIIPAIENGESISECLGRAGVLPQVVLDMLDTGERTGNIDETLSKAAEYMESESTASIEILTIVAFVVLLLIALLIGAISVLSGWKAHLGRYDGML